MAEDPIPCLVTVRASDGAVSVCKLLETRIGLGLVDGELYVRIGQLRPQVRKVTNRLGFLSNHRGFAWYYDEGEYGRSNGWETTKKAALAAMLAYGGYAEAAPNATNPGLF